MYASEKKRISSTFCDLRSIDIERNEFLRTLQNSGLRIDLDISPCVVSEGNLSLGKHFNTGAFTSPRILLSIKSLETFIAWNRWISWTNGKVERLPSISRVSFESMKPEMWCNSPLFRKVFKPGIVLIKIRWLMVSTEKSINLDSFLKVLEMRASEYLCKHWGDNRSYCWVVARQKFVFFWIYKFPSFCDNNSKTSFRDIKTLRGETNFSQNHFSFSLQIYLIG